MAGSNKNNSDALLVEELIKDLEGNAAQIQQILKEIRDSELSINTVKIELKYLMENFKELSGIIRDGGGQSSVLTRMILVEKAIEEIKIFIAEQEKKKDETKKEEASVLAAEKTGKWQVYAALATGLIGLFTAAATLLINLFSK